MLCSPPAGIVGLTTRGGTLTADTVTTAATLDLLAADFRVDSPAVREAAQRHWYAMTPLGPAVLRYEDCAAILRDRRFRQAGADHLADQGITDGPLADMWRDIILNIEGDRHGRLRRLVSQAFTPKAVDELRPRMREIVHSLVDAFAPAGECEFMAACADHYPPQVMFDLLGIPDEDHEQFLEWGKTLALTISYSVAEHAAAIDAARSDLYAATDWVRGRSIAPPSATPRRPTAGENDATGARKPPTGQTRNQPPKPPTPTPKPPADSPRARSWADHSIEIDFGP